MTHAKSRPVALRMIVGAAAVVAALLAFVPAASAARDPISGGTTDLHLKQGFLKKLTNLGVGLAGVSTGQASGNKISLPVTEGMFDPTNAQGHFTSPGGFQLVKGARSVPITGVEVNTVHSFVRATIAGAHMQFGTFGTPTIGREGFGARIKAGQLTLTQKAATRISNKLGLQGSQRINQRVMSNEFSITSPSTLTILGQNEATLEALRRDAQKIRRKGRRRCRSGIKPIAPAKNSKVTNFTFPITGGTLATELHLRPGHLDRRRRNRQERQNPFADDENHQHPGRIRPEDGDGRTRNHPGPALPGQTGRSSIVDLVFPANAIQSNPTTRQITIKGAEAKLQAVAAATLNSGVQPGRRKSASGEQ